MQYTHETFIPKYVKYEPCTDCTSNSKIGSGQIPSIPPTWLREPGSVIALTNLMTGQYLNINGAKKAQTSSGISSAAPAAQFKIVKITGQMPNFNVVLQNQGTQECLLVFGFEGADYSKGGQVGTYPGRCDGNNPQEVFSIQFVPPTECPFSDKTIIRLINGLSKQALIAYGIERTPPNPTNNVGTYPNRTGCNKQNLWAVEVL